MSMGCNCRKLDINKRYNLKYIRKLAMIYSINTKQDIQIFEYEAGSQKLYNFEPLNNYRKNIIENIKYNKI